MPNAHVGVDVDVAQIRAECDALVICTGATWPRDLKIPNRSADGIHFAMEYLQVRARYVCFAVVVAHVLESLTRNLFSTQNLKTAITSMLKGRMSSSLEVVTLAMIVLVLLCVTEPSR